MRTSVDSNDHLRIGQPVERQRPRHGNHMPSIDQPLAIRPIGRIEMHLGGVLPQTRGNHMLRLLDSDAIHMVDLLANLVVTPPMRLPSQIKIVIAEVQSFWDHQIINRQPSFQFRYHRLRRWCVNFPLTDHHPTHVFQHRFATLISTSGAHPHNACLTIRVLLNPNHFRRRCQRIPGINGQQKPPLGIA